MTEVYIGIGSNLGDRIANISRAVALFSSYGNIELMSSVYETEPEGLKGQPDFLNCVIKAQIEIDPARLLAVLKKIEKEMGRKRGRRNGPRLIDLDLLFYNNRVIDTPDLTVPHPRLPQRAFVLVPMVEIARGLVHPALHKSMLQLLTELESAGRVDKRQDLKIGIKES